MGLPAEKTRFTAEDYLQWEAGQTLRHEYVDGEVFAMAGADDRHVTVSLNAAMALRQHLSGTPCRTYMADMKLHVQAANSFHYPDVMVTCSPADAQDRLVKREPRLLIEVLSESTAGYDRGAKFGFYRLLPSLQEYALIDPQDRTVDVYRKGPDGLWVLHPFAAGATVRLDSVGLDLPAVMLFAEVDDAPAAA
ncbi:Uma2 family endonuclease [Tepidicella xavieri]|jgi:Uma2 family endonuclease|uniref:Uma2 family endonuclease n=1 Tax=Tepidicella xavieri TaxID=360241 RepID=A0A4R6UQ45_9BURK|nr:Uma2 family endonuclease [Tepidicella xavieri]TDQ45374.1 Uma2 family endonuclease [Tepidicella xavieri]